MVKLYSADELNDDIEATATRVKWADSKSNTRRLECLKGRGHCRKAARWNLGSKATLTIRKTFKYKSGSSKCASESTDDDY